MSCRGCACLFCVRSCELDVRYLTIGELPDGVEVCWTCDECQYYTGDRSLGYQWRPECPEQIIARKRIEAVADANRRKLKLIK